MGCWIHTLHTLLKLLFRDVVLFTHFGVGIWATVQPWKRLWASNKQRIAAQHPYHPWHLQLIRSHVGLEGGLFNQFQSISTDLSIDSSWISEGDRTPVDQHRPTRKLWVEVWPWPTALEGAQCFVPSPPGRDQRLDQWPGHQSQRSQRSQRPCLWWVDPQNFFLGPRPAFFRWGSINFWYPKCWNTIYLAIYTILYYSILYYTILYYTILYYYIMLYYIYIILYYVMLYYIMLCYVILYYIVIILYCIMLYYIILYCNYIILYYVILYYIII